jgi:hypothetical protein
LLFGLFLFFGPPETARLDNDLILLAFLFNFYSRHIDLSVGFALLFEHDEQKKDNEDANSDPGFGFGP